MSETSKFVTDNVVKMEWERSKALYKKGSKSRKVFILAGKDYETKLGTVTVFFNCDTVFVWADNAGEPDEDRYNAKELKDWVKDNYDESFPLNYNNYIPIIDYGSNSVNMDMIEKYGLEEYVDDIVARLDDVRPYAEEVEESLF